MLELHYNINLIKKNITASDVDRCIGSILVSMIDSHSCDRGSSPGQGNHIIILYALNNIQLISDEYSAELVLYLYE